MPVAFLVASILVTSWNLTVALIAYSSGLGPFRNGDTYREMKRTVRVIRAEVGKPDLDARTEAWKRNGGTSAIENVRSRMTETPTEVAVETAYAEESVYVDVDGRREKRRCSLCLN